MRKRPSVFVAFALLTAVVVTGETRAAAQIAAQEQEQRPALASYGRLPLHFEANRGQTAERVKFLARGSGYTLFLTSTEAMLVLRKPATPPSIVRTRLLGANARPVVEGQQELPGRSHYFVGSDRKRWRKDVPQYARVEYKDVYPGVSLAYYGNQGQLEYDFVVKPGADPGSIRLGIEGADEIKVDADGNLHVCLPGGEMLQRAPVVYQEISGTRKLIAGRFVLRGRAEVGFEVGPYVTGRQLVLDPVLIYSTYLGGSAEDLGHVAVDASGSAYVAGYTTSTDFPTANALQAENHGFYDAFVAKLNPAGSALVYSTYLGGSISEYATGIAVDASGNAYITGSTTSTDFPTANALQAEHGGLYDGFVAKLNSAGSALVYSTYLGGSGYDQGNGIAVDGAGSAYVTGYTSSTDFPTANAVQPEKRGSDTEYDAFVTRLNAAGSTLAYSTYLGGSAYDQGNGIAVDASGGAYLIGYTNSTDFPIANALQAENGGAVDAFLTKLDAAGSALVYSTYLGGSADDIGSGIAVDASGNPYLTGRTFSTDFPTRNPFQAANGGGVDAFVTRLNAEGSSLVYSTYLGGSADDAAADIAVDASRHAYITGYTISTNFPTRNPLQAAKHGAFDAFVAKFNTTVAGATTVGSLMYSTYLGGSGNDFGSSVAVDGSRNAYVSGSTASTDFPTRKALQPENAGDNDAFVSKIGTTPNSGAQGRADEGNKPPPDQP
jgi:hypothetical protein